MENILVSVIIPAYNCVKSIRQSLNSALEQDVPCEIIVIDDCSSDGLDQVMKEYGDYSNIIYLKNSKNMGVAASRNRGVAAAHGRYIAFLDSDDIWAADKLKKQLRYIARTKAVICSTARELMKPDGTLTGRIIPVKEQFTFQDLLKQNPINCSSVLICTDVAREFPMHHDDSHEDYLMWLEVLNKYQFGCAVNEPLLKYRLSSSGKSGSKLHSAAMTFRVYQYMGFGFFKSVYCFLSYAFCSILKYWKAICKS